MITRGIRILASRRQEGQGVSIFTDSRAMTRIQSGAPRPYQDMADEIIGLISKIYERDNALTIRWVSGHKGAPGNETADAFAKGAANEKTSDNKSRKAMEWISLPFLKRKAAEKATRQWRRHILKQKRGRPNSKPRITATLRTATKTIAGGFYQLLNGHVISALSLSDK